LLRLRLRQHDLLPGAHEGKRLGEFFLKLLCCPRLRFLYSMVTFISSWGSPGTASVTLHSRIPFTSSALNLCHDASVGRTNRQDSLVSACCWAVVSNSHYGAVEILPCAALVRRVHHV
jgi:hypothetical protein